MLFVERKGRVGKAERMLGKGSPSEGGRKAQMAFRNHRGAHIFRAPKASC